MLPLPVSDNDSMTSKDHSTNPQVTNHLSSEDEDILVQMAMIQSKFEKEQKERARAVLRRDEALALADEKTIEVVCAISLLEYKERQRVFSAAESEEEKLNRLEEQRRAEIQCRKEEAAAKRVEAMNKLIQAKTKANEMKLQAITAAAAYEEREKNRLEEKASAESSKYETEARATIQALEKQKEEARLRREEAEKKAELAKQKAAEVRQRALEAATALRAKSRQRIDSTLEKEEAERLLREKNELGKIAQLRDDAVQRRKDLEAQLAEAQKKAEALKLQVQDRSLNTLSA